MECEFPGGVWPVMLTPFTKRKEVNYRALKELVEWYIKNGASGLFAVCQSSEMFFLSLEERVKICRCVVEQVAGRVPVIASGHVSDSIKDQAKEINAITDTKVDAVILITNRFAKQDEDDDIWIKNCEKLFKQINKEIPLGFYECPYPYKRLLSPSNLEWCVKTGRFFFLKDTCCDCKEISVKLDLIKNSKLKLYNANTATLLESLRGGAAGYSGVMANFHPTLYAWLCEHYKEERAEVLADHLTMMSYIERQNYPVNAKYNLGALEGLSLIPSCRVREGSLSETEKKEIKMMQRIAKSLMLEYGLGQEILEDIHNEGYDKGKKEQAK